MNNNGNIDPAPKTLISNSESQIICKQISEVLKQWFGRRTQNYFELKHVFWLLKSNSSPGLIRNVKALNRFVKRGPSVKHLNVRELAKSEFSRKTYFCKLDLSNGYLHLISECLFFKHLILVSHWKAHSTRSLSCIYI